MEEDGLKFYSLLVRLFIYLEVIREHHSSGLWRSLLQGSLALARFMLAIASGDPQTAGDSKKY